jgi:CelD/BcsL family acetyltransferase involved in cellulose biosynthesis
MQPRSMCSSSSSSLRIETIDPLSDGSWDHDVAAHPDATFFHGAAWARVLHRTYGHKPIYLRFYRGEGDLMALLPLMDVRSWVTGRRGISLPFSDFCGPLIFGTESVDFLFPPLMEMGRERKWRHFEIREQKPGGDGGGGSRSSASEGETLLGHRLDLRVGEEELLRGVKSSVRRALRKSERSGLSVEVTDTREALREFYGLHALTRRKHGLPPQPLSFFLNIEEDVFRAGLGFVVVARLGVRPVAANVYFRSGKKAIYKFGASDPQFQALRGSNLVMWEGIRFLTHEGVESLHFGRTSGGNEGLRRYKLSWGAREEPLGYLKHYFPLGRRRVSGRGGLPLHLDFRRLPLSLNCIAGALLYPHLD